MGRIFLEHGVDVTSVCRWWRVEKSAGGRQKLRLHRQSGVQTAVADYQQNWWVSRCCVVRIAVWFSVCWGFLLYSSFQAWPCFRYIQVSAHHFYRWSCLSDFYSQLYFLTSKAMYAPEKYARTSTHTERHCCLFFLYLKSLSENITL